MSDRAQLASRFDDGKAPDAMRTIGEVSAAFDIKPHVLRYWEQQFPMLSPLKRSGGRRLYRPEDVALVERIDQLVNRQGYTLKGARQALEQGDEAPATGATLAATATAGEVASGVTSADVLPRLHAIRDRLASALEI